jgi:uncharacterized SAM-binding protein YcdF (DUF218 family)
MALGDVLCLSSLLASVVCFLRIGRAYLYASGVGFLGRVRDDDCSASAAILALGGCAVRELEAAHLAKHHAPTAHLYISSGDLPSGHIALALLKNRMTVDRSAVDTLTNFTSLYGQLIARSTRSVTVVTSGHHMPRALAIGRIVLGDAGIYVKKHVVVNSNYPAHPESLWRVLRDVVRALLWVFTGLDGRSIALYVHPYRNPDSGIVRDELDGLETGNYRDCEAPFER